MFLRRYCKNLLILACVMFSVSATAQPESQLSAAIVNHFTVLRNYYTDAHLTFDDQGHLTSRGTPGFGPIEGRLYVDDLLIKHGKLVIVGNRPVDVYNEDKDQVQPVSVRRKVKIEIDLPNGEPPGKVIPNLLERVFFTSAEVDQMKCSPDETKNFVEQLQKSREIYLTAVPKKEPPAPEAQSLDELRRACYPIGDRAYSVGKGVKPPQAIKAPDPSFTNEALRAHKTGTVVLMCIIDTDGRPTSFIVSRPVGYGLDEAALNAVRTWTFTPGTFQGKSVPVVTYVAINFALRR